MATNVPKNNLTLPKFIQVYAMLSGVRKGKFEAWLGAQVGKKSVHLLKLLQYIDTHLEEIIAEYAPDDEKRGRGNYWSIPAWQAMFVGNSARLQEVGESPTDSGFNVRFNRELTDITHYLEDFLLWERFSQQTMRKKIMLMEIYQDMKLPELVDGILVYAEKAVKKATTRDLGYYRDAYDVAQWLVASVINKPVMEQLPATQALHERYKAYFITQYLRMLLSSLQKTVTTMPRDMENSHSEVLAALDKEFIVYASIMAAVRSDMALMALPLVQLYLWIADLYLTVTDITSEVSIPAESRRILGILKEVEQAIPLENAIECYRWVRGAVVYWHNRKPSQDTYTFLWELYEISARYKWLLVDGILLGSDYRGMAKVAAQFPNGEQKFKELIRLYSLTKLLADEGREQVILLAEAHFAEQRKDYRNVRKILSGYNTFQHPYYKLEAYQMYLSAKVAQKEYINDRQAWKSLMQEIGIGYQWIEEAKGHLQVAVLQNFAQKLSLLKSIAQSNRSVKTTNAAPQS